jgi:predicted transcriptional regulator
MVTHMLIPCEVAVKSVVPSIRAFVAIELTQSYNMKQIKVAELLGITQTAVSKYTTQVRGATLKIDQTEEIQTMMKKIANQLANKEITRQDLIIKFCEVCETVRKTGIMCNLCKRSDPTINVKTCLICKPYDKIICKPYDKSNIKK